MLKEYSPFTPGVPVPIEFFIGRTEEIQKIISSVKRSIALSTVERLFVLGERGIGKSSICKFARLVAERDLNILGLHVFLGGVTTVEEIVHRIFDRLLRENVDKPWFDKIKQFLGNHIKQLDIFGLTVEFSASHHELQRAANDFIPALKNLLRQLAPEKRGILLILDDFNGLAPSEKFANWFKSLIDELSTSSTPIPVIFILVGLPERRQQLIKAQPSLDRVFEIIKIAKFNPEETSDFYDRTFRKVNVSINKEALELLGRYSGGYPVLMHELGDAVFKIDSDGVIEKEDTLKGIIQAAQIIGAKYIEPNISAAIRSEHYQDILHKIAEGSIGSKFKRKEISSRLTNKEIKVLDNFLRRMEKLGLIRKDREHGPGSYEFTSELHYLFFWLQTVASESNSK
jgi:hypothetical protein